MARVYLKKAEKTAKTDAGSTQDIVRGILSDIEEGREKVALEISAKFDKYSGNAILSRDEIDEAKEKIPQKLRDDMHYAHDNIMRFALAQKGTMSNMEMELHPGLITGQKLIPVNAAGCYVPGGRYAHIASAMMTVTTAKAAGVGHITACSPPNGDEGINPAIIYAADLAGADKILSLGGVQGVASMTYGLFDLPEADIIVGPGNQFVAEAKRILFGKVGIDLLHFGGMSYPSGHASNALLTWGVLAYLIYRYAHVDRYRGRLASAGVATISLTVCTVSLIRDTHWFSDLLGGLFIGGSLLVLIIAIDRYWPSNSQLS